MPVGTSKKKATTSTKANDEATTTPTVGGPGTTGRVSSASSTATSGSSSASGSSSSSSDSSSSSSDSSSSDSDGSNSSVPHTTTGTPTTNDSNKSPKATTKIRRGSRSCSSRSRASSVASSASSRDSKGVKSSSTKSKASTTIRKVSSTSSAINKSKTTSNVTTKSKPTDAASSKMKSIPAHGKNKSSLAASSASNKTGATSSVVNTPTPNTTGGKKSKLVKSGCVTNTRTIKPLIPSRPLAPPSGKVLPGTLSQTPKVPATTNEGTNVFGEKTKSMTSKKSNPVPADSSTKSVSSSTTKKRQRKCGSSVVSTTTGPATPTKVGSAADLRTRSRSSCSSISSASSSAASSSSEIENSSMTDSPRKTKPNIPKRQAVNSKDSSSVKIENKASGSNSNKKPQKTLKKKLQVVRNLNADLLSSADEDDVKQKQDDGSNVAPTKRKASGQRRPVTRRQKSSNIKKTIPTTTSFNQGMLLAAANSMNTITCSPSTTSTGKKSGGGGKSTNSPSSSLALLPPSSSIINRRSTSNSSANSMSEDSDAGATRRGRQRTKDPFVSNALTTLGGVQKNKYLSTWDSDFSDDNFNQHFNHSAANFIRVPAKTSNRPRTFDFTQGLLDAEAFEPPRCPFPSCNSSGHLSGRYPNHNFLSCCPRYHGFETHECTENEEERSRRELERTRYRNILSTPGKKPPKPTSETKVWLGEMKVLKENQTEDGLTNQYDSLLWKDALAIAADRIEREQNEGITNQGIYYRLSMAVAMGRFEMKCWCASPYPEPLSQNKRLFVCEFCLKPVGSGTVLRRHCAKCVWRHPPGDEIYRKDRLSVWEVDGKKQKTYCQNLCLLAKCFLDHKTLYLDVDPFLFYVMTLADSQGCHIVGYFSKEKNSFLNYNVSCILTLPPYQRQGFGRLLIDFSYLLTRVEGKIGSPEKPLSDLGLISYRSYWKDAVLRRLCACASREINIKDLSIELGVSTADLISTLQYLGMLKYWKGKHLVLKKQDVLEEYLERVRRRGNESRQIDSSCLRWRPFQPTAEDHSSSEKS